MRMKMSQTSDLLAAWGCPKKYREPASSYSGYYAPKAVQAASRAINGYCEHNDALQAMWDAQDMDAVREWAESDAWYAAGYETSGHDADGAEEYAAGVRQALLAMAEEVEQ